VHGKYVLSDGVRTVELHPVQGGAHAQGMLVAYLPAEKMLINGDLYTPPASGVPLPAANPNMRTLHQNMQRLRLDVAQHVPLHGAPGPNEDFLKIVAGGTE
jgi:glyoxylase-like metal-dependent hydrolase (beta-lactamase superfamily II)